MARSASLSGFPEYLPEERLIEIHFLEVAQAIFQAHGFSSLETRAVETVDTLLQKGEIDKEVYAVSRIHADEGARDAKLALHFDLTVPLARYVVENAGYLAFPFRRFQIQKVWRGERPQEGRFREFTQADIDIIGDGELSPRFDAEALGTMAKVLTALPIPPFTMRVNNRKLAEGFYRGIGLTDAGAVLRTIDKLEKVGPERVTELLQSEAGATAEQARLALELASIRSNDLSFVDRVRALGVNDDLLNEGLAELEELLSLLQSQVASGALRGHVIADLSIARGLDYYTGTVLETTIEGLEELGSVSSGGRYDALARKGKRVFPGVGLTLGLSRLLSRLIGDGTLTASRAVPTVVYVALNHDDDWQRAQAVADTLRERNISVEVAAQAEKFGKQIKYADRRGIPFVWFLGEGSTDQVKDLRSGEQVEATADSWEPSDEDRTVRVIARTD